MCHGWRKMRHKGSFLIEIILSVVILSVGILAVMQVYALQRASARLNEEYTRSIFLLADGLGAVLAGVDVGSFYRQGDVAEGPFFSTEVKSLFDEKERLDEVSITLGGRQEQHKRAMALTSYVQKTSTAL
jgi:hypothetical protein